MEFFEQQQPLPGSRTCVGCDGQTFRNREDGLCPRCAWGAETLIEQVELDGLDRDLRLLTAFEAYCHLREHGAARGMAFGGNLPPVPTITERAVPAPAMGNAGGAWSATGGVPSASGSMSSATGGARQVPFVAPAVPGNDTTPTRPLFINPGPGASRNVFAPNTPLPEVPRLRKGA